MSTYRGNRLQDLLDGIRAEFENVRAEASNYRLHKDENDLKFSHHLSELAKIKQTVFDLENTHKLMRESYEQEIFRLKKELELKDKQLAMKARPPPQAHVLAPPQMPYKLYLPAPGALPRAYPGVMPGTSVPIGAPVLSPAISNPALAGLPPPAAPPAAPITTQPAQPAQPVQQTQQTAVVAPKTPPARREIPAFLADLNVALVPESQKKQSQDYYVLYNPAKPRKTDVEMVHLLDHTSVVCCVRFSQDGKYLATGCNKTTQVYSVETGELVARLLDSNVPSEGAGLGDLYIRLVCFLPDGKTLATGAEDKLIRIWDLSTQRIVKYLKGHEQDIYSLDFFPDGRKLVSGSGDRTVRIWDLTSGLTQLTLTIEDGVTTVAVLTDGKLIAAGSLDRTVRVWDAVTGFLVERLDLESEHDQGHKDLVYSVIFTGTGNEIASGSLDATVKLWDLGQHPGERKAARCKMTYVGHKDFVLSVCALPKGEYILLGLKDRGVIFWEKNTGDALMMLQGHRNSVISVNVSGNPVVGGGMFATGLGDCKARIWKWFSV